MDGIKVALVLAWDGLRGLASSALAWVLGIRRDPNDEDGDGSTF
jgi:hypothetical protein